MCSHAAFLWNVRYSDSYWRYNPEWVVCTNRHKCIAHNAKKNNNQPNKQKCTTKQKPHKSWNYWVAEFFKYSETWLLHHNSGQFSKQRNAWQFFCQHPSLNTREQRYHLYHVYLSDDIVSLFLLMKDSDLRQEFRNGGEVLKRGIWLSHP